jgi:hypothetical protein
MVRRAIKGSPWRVAVLFFLFMKRTQGRAWSRIGGVATLSAESGEADG